MRTWPAERVAEAAGARLLAPAREPGGPLRAAVDSRAVGPGDLFVGLPGERVDGGRFAAAALEAGAWGVLVAAEHGDRARDRDGAVLVADDPLAALARLTTARRRDLGVPTVGITGSNGKTSTKDLLLGMLRAAGRRPHGTRQNLNTEIGLPLTVLEAPDDADVLVLEMAMRGSGQIAELVAMAEPDVGVITSIGPVHLELLGTVEAIAAAKFEIVAGLRPGATAVLPYGEPLLRPHRPPDGVEVVTFGPGGDVADLDGLEIGFSSAHMRANALAALAAARAVGAQPHGRIAIELSAHRGQTTVLAGGITVVDDCYNANPVSMRAALDDLARAPGRRVAVLGDMLELGPDAGRFHAEIGAYARDGRADVLVTVGPLAARMGGDHGVETALDAIPVLEALLRPGDTVLVKGSRGVGLEVVAEAL